ncbi:MAG TPA: sensor histidine kinase [Armatimonadota bacterium]|nr:sensor histidine kinase [Armatimonadota bacterium]
MKERTQRRDLAAVTRAAQHIWIAVAFIFIWLHFSYVRPHLRRLDWQIYSLYFLAVAGVAARYLTGIRYGHARWHRVLFDGLSILFIALGVNITGGIRSDLWLVYLIFIIAETLAGSSRGFLITDAVAMISYVLATWPRSVQVAGQEYAELLVTRIFFMVLVASIARTIAAEERQRQEDVSALREALSVSEERRRLARDLHDGIGHVLTRVILSLEVARRQATREPEAAAEAMGQQATALRGAMEEMRQIVATLRTDTAAFNVQSTVRGMAAQLAETAAFKLEVHVPEAPLPLSAHRQYHLSRVIQEALTNCLRHAHAENVTVEVQVHETPVTAPRVVAVIQDDGVGFDPQSVDGRGGHGLRGMAERLTPYEGRVVVESSPGGGTRVTAEVPADL